MEFIHSIYPLSSAERGEERRIILCHSSTLQKCRKIVDQMGQQIENGLHNPKGSSLLAVFGSELRYCRSCDNHDFNFGPFGSSCVYGSLLHLIVKIHTPPVDRWDCSIFNFFVEPFVSESVRCFSLPLTV